MASTKGKRMSKHAWIKAWCRLTQLSGGRGEGEIEDEDNSTLHFPL